MVRYLTDITEFKAFIGLCYPRGLLDQTTCNSCLCSVKRDRPFFGACMSVFRFSLLHANLSFNGHQNIRKRKAKHDVYYDWFSSVREILEMSNTKCSEALIPGEFLFLEDVAYSARNTVSFCNGSKPLKTELIFK